MIPKRGLEAWHESDTVTLSSSNVTAMYDKTGNGLTLTCPSNYPTIGTTNILGRTIPVVSFDGTQNPLQSADAPTSKHFFVVASYADATFGANPPGLLTDLSTLPILVGTGSGSTFIDLTSYYGSYTYKRRDVVFAAGSMSASMSGAISIFEVVIPSGAALDGIQIGRDRATSNRKWKGSFILDLVYSRVLAADEVLSVYEYIAMRYLVWKRVSSGLDVWPFQPEWGFNAPASKRVLSSTSVSGEFKGRTKGAAKQGFAPRFEARWPEEFDAAKVFWDTKNPGTPFIYRDAAFSPARDNTVRFTGEALDRQSIDYRDINYAWQAVEV